MASRAYDTLYMFVLARVIVLTVCLPMSKDDQNSRCSYKVWSVFALVSTASIAVRLAATMMTSISFIVTTIFIMTIAIYFNIMIMNTGFLSAFTVPIRSTRSSSSS